MGRMIMKLTKIIGLLALLIGGLTYLSNCGGGDDPPPPQLPDEPTAQEEVTQDLSQSWSIGTTGSVKRDGVDISSDLSDLVVTFRDNFTYSSSGGKELWVETSNGSWQYASSNSNDASSILIGNNEISMTVTSTTLRLLFTIPEGSAGIGARTSGIEGSFEFFFSQ